METFQETPRMPFILILLIYGNEKINDYFMHWKVAKRENLYNIVQLPKEEKAKHESVTLGSTYWERDDPDQ